MKNISAKNSIIRQLPWFAIQSDMSLILWPFAVLTGTRFVAEHIKPLWFPLAIAYIALTLILIPKKNWPNIGLKKPSALWSMFVGMGAAAIIKLVTILLMFSFLGQSKVNWELDVAKSLKAMPSQAIPVIIITLFFMILVPIAEEVFFRTFQSTGQAKYGALAGISISAFAFGFSHIDKYLVPFSLAGILLRLIPITVYGLVHAWVYHKTGSTYASMASHLTGNIAEAIILTLFILPIMQ